MSDELKPETIWVQLDPYGNAQWCGRKVSPADIEYILKSEHDTELAGLRLALDAANQHAQACEQAMLDAKAEAERLRVTVDTQAEWIDDALNLYPMLEKLHEEAKKES